MRKMDMVQDLIADAAEEIGKIEKYKEALQNGNGSILDWEIKRPNRQRILDDLKMARRLSLEVEKEAARLW